MHQFKKLSFTSNDHDTVWWGQPSGKSDGWKDMLSLGIGMESIWIEHTSMPDFVDGLLALVDEDYSITDQLHDAVE